jgi:hypothetical protein
MPRHWLIFLDKKSWLYLGHTNDKFVGYTCYSTVRTDTSVWYCCDAQNGRFGAVPFVRTLQPLWWLRTLLTWCMSNEHSRNLLRLPLHRLQASVVILGYLSITQGIKTMILTIKSTNLSQFEEICMMENLPRTKTSTAWQSCRKY